METSCATRRYFAEYFSRVTHQARRHSTNRLTGAIIAPSMYIYKHTFKGVEKVCLRSGGSFGEFGVGGGREWFLPCPFLPSFQKKLTYDWKDGRSEAFVQETSKEEQVTSSGDDVGARRLVCLCVRSLAGGGACHSRTLRRAVPPPSVMRTSRPRLFSFFVNPLIALG